MPDPPEIYKLDNFYSRSFYGDSIKYKKNVRRESICLDLEDLAVIMEDPAAREVIVAAPDLAAVREAIMAAPDLAAALARPEVECIAVPPWVAVCGVPRPAVAADAAGVFCR